MRPCNRKRNRLRGFWLGTCAVLAVLSANGQPGNAAAIKTIKPSNTVTAAIPRGGWAYWDRYYLRALATRNLKVNGPNALRVLRLDASGRLPDIPMVQYLHWRRSLRPLNFDRYHPELSCMMKWDLYARGLASTPPACGGPIIPGGVRPPVVVPPIPEPSSVLVAAGCVAAAAFSARRRRKGVPAREVC